MRMNRSLMITVLAAVLAAWTGLLLSGCATTGRGKAAGPDVESPRRIDELGAAPKQTSGSSPQVRKEPVVSKGGSGGKQPVGQANPGQKPRVQEASPKADEGMFKRYATHLKQALDRVLPKTLADINWNGILTVLGGIVVLGLIFGLAFGLGRLSLRRRGAGRLGGGRRTVEHAPGAVPGEPVYQASRYPADTARPGVKERMAS